MVITNSYEFNFLKPIHMKKKLFTICVLSITLWSFATDRSYASTRKQDDTSIIPPIIIRPPVNRLEMQYYETSFVNKSTFVDACFEGQKIILGKIYQKPKNSSNR